MTQVNDDRVLGVLVGGIAVYLLFCWRKHRRVRFVGSGSTTAGARLASPSAAASCCDCASTPPTGSTVASGGLGNYTQSNQPSPMGRVIPVIVPPIYAGVASPDELDIVAPVVRLDAGGFDQFPDGPYLWSNKG